MQAVLKIHTLFLVFFDTKKYNGSCQRCRKTRNSNLVICQEVIKKDFNENR